MQTIRVVVVGDEKVGKTSLLRAFFENTFSNDAIPFGEFKKEVMAQGNNLNLDLYDFTGPLSYPQTDVFIFCFSIADPESLKHLTDKWHPESLHHCEKVPIVLVGTKSDLRDDKSQTVISPEQGMEMARKLQATKFIECSSQTQRGIKQVFDEVALAYLNSPHPKRKTTKSKSESGSESKSKSKSKCTLL